MSTDTLNNHEPEQEQVQKQSPTQGDISKTAENIENSLKLWLEAEKVEKEESIKAESDLENALNGSDTPNDQEQSIRDKSIDFSSELFKINNTISTIKDKIKLIEEKNELTTSDKREKYKLRKKINELQDEKLTIRDKIDNEIDKDTTIINNDTKVTNQNLAIENNNITIEPLANHQKAI